jgi:L-alanine-DL-glutamate epimerase-like enolase superfamily enzyme
MRILDIRHRSVPISRYAPGVAVSAELDTTIVAIVTDQTNSEGTIIGYGFGSIGRFAQDGLISQRFAPRLLNADPGVVLHADGLAIDPCLASRVMMAGEKPGGHGERCVAIGALDMAIWDAAAKVRGLPLFRLLASTFGNGEPLKSVPVYAGGGYYFPANDLERLRAEMMNFRDAGFTTAKMKIGRALHEDCARIEIALGVFGSGAALAADAMNSYQPDQARDVARAIEPYGLRWFEDVCDPLDYQTHTDLASMYAPPLSAGEAIFSLSDARNLLRYGGLRKEHDVLTFDPAHCYGIVGFVEIVRHFEEAGWSRSQFQPHGGHLFGLHVAAGLALGGCECNPHNFQPFGGFSDGAVINDGRISLPEWPGIGFEARARLMDLFRTLL